RADPLAEIFELALELIDFHRAADANTAAPALASGRQQVIDEQLQAPLAEVLVDVQPVDQMRRSGGRRELGALLEVVEGDGVEAAPAARHVRPHLQMPPADDARVAQLEHPVEGRLREGLSP